MCQAIPEFPVDNIDPEAIVSRLVGNESYIKCPIVERIPGT
jgi:hypothetical protein